MSMSLEHDYIGLSSELPSMENTSDNKNTATPGRGGGLNLKATELRLGLPGSESPERGNNQSPDPPPPPPHHQLSIGLNNNNKSCFASSGAKRGFSVALHDGSGNWVFSATAGSDSGKVINGSGCGQTGKDSGLPQSPKKEATKEKKTTQVGAAAAAAANGHAVAPASKAQVVGWPPIRSFRKNTMASQSPKNEGDAENKSGSSCLYVKVSMDGAPYLRKVDLRTYSSYMELSSALEKMFSCFTIGQCGSHGVPGRDGLSENGLMDLLHGSEYVLTYEDKDGDWMLVGDVPWKMFANSCRRLRIMKSSEAVGLAPRAMEKCRSRN